MPIAENLAKITDLSTSPDSNGRQECDKIGSSGSSDEETDGEQDTRLKEQSFSFENSENVFLLYKILNIVIQKQ